MRVKFQFPDDTGDGRLSAQLQQLEFRGISAETALNLIIGTITFGALGVGTIIFTVTTNLLGDMVTGGLFGVASAAALFYWWAKPFVVVVRQ